MGVVEWLAMTPNSTKKMKLTLNTPLMLLALASTALGQNNPGPRNWFGPDFSSRRDMPRPTALSGIRAGQNTVKRWNEIAVNASGLDHTSVSVGETRIYGEQLGPCRASRAIAIVHIAMFEAHNAAVGQPFRSYLSLPRAAGKVSADAALAQAARDALVAMFPSQSAGFDAALAEDLTRIPNGASENNGIALGKSAAAAILAQRADDRSNHAELQVGVDFITSKEPGKWRQDPISKSPVALGALWHTVRPFMMTSAAQFRLPPPPALNSMEYSIAFVEVKRLGGDGVTTATERTEEESFIGTFWAYDGTPSLCAPPRLYNQIAIRIADQMGTTGLDLSRLLVLANVAMADTGIAAWDSKYFYQVGRPVTAIREASSGGAQDDGNDDTVGDAAYSPLGAPASNLQGPNFTPPFPAYPSGHAAFGGALFQTLRRYYGRDDIAFTFVSDEYNGITTDNTGAVRALKPRSFINLSEAENENAASRIYLGIHWNFDASQGVVQGRNVANHIVDNLYPPVPQRQNQGQR